MRRSKHQTFFTGLKECQKFQQEFIANLAKALYASKICSYAQGLGIIKAASDKFGWDIDLSEYVKLQRGGCIIRTKFLDNIQAAFQKDPDLPNLMLDPDVAKELGLANHSWREVINYSSPNGIACPSLGGNWWF